MHQFRGVFCRGLQYRVTRPSLHRRDKPSDPVGDHSQPIDRAVLRLRDDGWTNFPGEVQVSKKKGSEPTLDEQSKHASSSGPAERAEAQNSTDPGECVAGTDPVDACSALSSAPTRARDLRRSAHFSQDP